MTADASIGVVAAIDGPVVELRFPLERAVMPALGNLVACAIEGAAPVLVEVHLHSARDRVRGVALGDTRGLTVGAEARDTGEPLRVPVGEQTRGRVLDLFGRPLDGGPPLTGEAWSIFRPSPPLMRRRARREVFETGIKVLDLLCPLPRGGNTGLFGGAGVGKTVLMMELMHN
ncbi:MAG: F0F1 ATP synthase subunit beta, partial [Myxococcales bacterium]|nr:F0F1 ATP synthase subunit beta [Myxococcales bacterium]